MQIHAVTEAEMANAQVVREFIESMGKVPAEERYGRAFAADSRVWWESLPGSETQWLEDTYYQGPAAAAAAASEYVSAGVIYNTSIHEIFACGPVVVTRRTDTPVEIAMGHDQAVHMSGVFTLREGKIVLWMDYIGHKTGMAG
ncbi:MAG TPA: limonene-1,2-epoxide hydrolase family protein [Novosphingobium sp.]